MNREAFERAWLDGKVAPYRIAKALAGIGPHEVERACGANDYVVSHWEDGTLYPSLADLQCISFLTAAPREYFVPDDPLDTCPPDVERFTPEAIAEGIRLHGRY